MNRAAQQLVEDDARLSRGIVTDQELVDEVREEERELEQRRSEEAARKSHESASRSLESGSSQSKSFFAVGGRGRRRSIGAHHGRKPKRDRAYWQNILVNVVLIACWYLFSSLIQLYNKWMFSPEHYAFGFPLFVTSFHMVVQFGLSALVLFLVPSLRPTSRPEPRDYALKAGPCGMATGLDIGLSNLSLKTITLSFYTMCKSSSLGFVLLFAFVFRLEKPSWRLVGIIGLITVGVVLMVSAETKFSLVGMILVLTASAMSGLRWSLTQMLLDKQAMGFTNPIATLFWLAPIMALVLGTCSIIFEGPGNIFGDPTFFGTFGLGLQTMALTVLPGVVAFFMTSSEFMLIARTSVVTLSVAGIFKEVLTIFISTTIFHDELTPINISGLCITIFGIALFNYLKYRDYDPDAAKRDGHAFATLPEERDVEADGDEPKLSMYNMGAESSLFVSDQHAYRLDKGEGQHAIGSDDEDSEDGIPLDDEDESGPHVRLLPPKSAEDHQIESLDQALQDDPALKALSSKQERLEKALDAHEPGEEWELFDADKEQGR